MPIVAGIDIGTRNLALCVVSLAQSSVIDLTEETLPEVHTTVKKVTIIHWNKTDLSGYHTSTCISCHKTATSVSNNQFYCGRHTPPSLRFLRSNGKNFTSSPKLKDLKAFLRQHGRERESRARTIEDLTFHVKSFATFPVLKPKFKPSLDNLTVAIDSWIEAHWEYLRDANEIIIENQPPRFANPMKRVQNLIHTRLEANFFANKTRRATIRLVNGRNRGAMTYSEHKKEATRRAGLIIRGTSWEDWFINQVKKDDLADSLLLTVDHGTPTP